MATLGSERFGVGAGGGTPGTLWYMLLSHCLTGGGADGWGSGVVFSLTSKLSRRGGGGIGELEGLTLFPSYLVDLFLCIRGFWL